ncbi:murein hydrolase activator EnvC family protein [Montanilutibacter psychrotolerans]|uniref:Peptidase M23 n=1 Tax=Montanilutibacter psychrotolerans TaxID=1327343 RepID=A0A3M8SNJ2_9GAMM|nr:peptidoglycan DD-metalloendopeptidase family protein [Lysobacter psychrotolerans]RNF82918.1 peptidase M23 [Lysobacter psychrotolerans]
MSRRALAVALVIASVLALPALRPAGAQSSRDAERRLDRVKRELKAVAVERRKLEDQRGGASRELRAADEQVGQSSRSLRDTEQRLANSASELASLQARRGELQVSIAARRTELASLLRAAYAERGDAPLKLLLAQDRVADAGRVLVYHRYLQQARARRIATLSAQTREIDSLERDIVASRASLAAARVQQRDRLSQLERDRQARAALVAQIDERYQDRSSRERALGRDAAGLERLLTQLRATAARAASERRAAAARNAARDKAATATGSGRTTPRRASVVASAVAPQVGGLGWPLSGSLLAGFGATMPDGRSSDGLLIAASAGTAVKAVADGRVVYAQWMTGYGLLLIIDHGGGTMSLYAHNDALLRDSGDRVSRGDAVATVGSSGGAGRPALYFELRRNGEPVNPNTFLRR